MSGEGPSNMLLEWERNEGTSSKVLGRGQTQKLKTPSTVEKNPIFSVLTVIALHCTCRKSYTNFRETRRLPAVAGLLVLSRISCSPELTSWSENRLALNKTTNFITIFVKELEPEAVSCHRHSRKQLTYLSFLWHPSQLFHHRYNIHCQHMDLETTFFIECCAWKTRSIRLLLCEVYSKKTMTLLQRKKN